MFRIDVVEFFDQECTGTKADRFESTALLLLLLTQHQHRKRNQSYNLGVNYNVRRRYGSRFVSGFSLCQITRELHATMSVEERSHSLRSVSSNSSISSGTSLSRRPRTRTRSKTLTGKSSPRGIVFSNEEAAALVQEPLAISPVDDSSMVAQSRAEVPNWAIADSLDSASTGKFKSEPIRVVRE